MGFATYFRHHTDGVFKPGCPDFIDIMPLFHNGGLLQKFCEFSHKQLRFTGLGKNGFPFEFYQIFVFSFTKKCEYMNEIICLGATRIAMIGTRGYIVGALIAAKMGIGILRVEIPDKLPGFLYLFSCFYYNNVCRITNGYHMTMQTRTRTLFII